MMMAEAHQRHIILISEGEKAPLDGDGCLLNSIQPLTFSKIISLLMFNRVSLLLFSLYSANYSTPVVCKDAVD